MAKKKIGIIFTAMTLAAVFGMMGCSAVDQKTQISSVSETESAGELIEKDGDLYYMKKGEQDTSFTGIASNADGQWYVNTGKVKTSYTGTCFYEDQFYYIENGKVTGTPKAITNDSDNAVSDDYLQFVTEQYNSLPEALRNAFENSGWSIYTTQMELSSDESCVGYTKQKIKQIVIRESADTSMKSLYHEFGHYLDYTMPDSEGTSYASINNHAKAAFYEESGTYYENLKEEYSSSDNVFTEYIAEAFLTYMTNPDGLKQYCPKTYDVVETMLVAHGVEF